MSAKLPRPGDAFLERKSMKSEEDSRTKPLFVYATLKSHKAQLRAMGHDLKGRATTLPGYSELHITAHDDRWPTLWQTPRGKVKGEILEVTPADLKKLDKWEDKYQRKSVETEDGRADTYVYKGGS